MGTRIESPLISTVLPTCDYARMFPHALGRDYRFFVCRHEGAITH